MLWHSHYKFLGSDSSGHSLSKDFWKDSNVLRNLGTPRQSTRIREIYHDISDEEISETIWSTSNFKACDSDGIPMEFFKAFDSLIKMTQKYQVKIIVIFHPALNVFQSLDQSYLE